MIEAQATSSPKPPPRRTRIPPLAAFFGALAGAVGALVGSMVVSIGLALALYADELSPEHLADPNFVSELITRYPVLASSVVATAVCLIGAPLVTAKLARASLREALGFRPAPWQAFVLAPIGILALGPTSDALVRWMKEIAPHASLGALESIEQVVQAHPYWMLWPVIALCPGFSEEIFFRGLVQRAAGFGRRAIVLSALTFSFFHMDPHHVAGVLPLGFYLAWLGARTGTTWVPIVAHTANNSMALLAGKLEADAPDTQIPLWVLPIGWAIAGACVWGIARVTRDRARWMGPAAAADASLLPTRSSRISPDWRIVRSVGAREEVLGYVRDAHMEGGQVVGHFQPGPSFDELHDAIAAMASDDPATRNKAEAALAGFAFEDMTTGQRLDGRPFLFEPRDGRVAFRAPS